ncbi:MAG: TetR/AcrR family transcriptional regulator [Clostridiales bacterium]|nr:TetR/AcrR family transcriptional regulator [Clostridiales bacterium]
MRTVKEPDIRKQEILEGALRVFAKNGYDKTTISSIAKELNISQGLCYRYFPSKEDIYNTAIEKYSDIILEEYLNSRQEKQNIKQWIDNISENISKLTVAEAKDKSLYALFHSENSQTLHNELLLNIASKILPYVQQTLRQAKEKGEISVESPENLAVIGLYGELGILLTKSIDKEERIEAIKNGWYNLLKLN